MLICIEDRTAKKAVKIPKTERINIMIKMMTLTICAVVALSINACASSGAAAKTPIPETTAITETTDIPKSTTPANTNPDTMIANPFVDCQTMETAAEVAGFEFRTPEQVEGISEKKIQAVDQEMIQVIYSADENQILIRKAPGTRNISGDYNNYQKEETITVDEMQVTLKGNDGVISLATWSANDYSYSIYVSAGMAQDSIVSLVQAIH